MPTNRTYRRRERRVFSDSTLAHILMRGHDWFQDLDGEVEDKQNLEMLGIAWEDDGIRKLVYTRCREAFPGKQPWGEMRFGKRV